MERITEILAILGDETALLALSDDELSALRDELAQLGQQVVAGSVDGVDDAIAVATEIGDFYEGALYVLAARAEVAQANAEALAAQAARFSTPVEPETPDTPDEGGEAADAVVTAPLAAAPAPAPEAAPAPAAEATPAPEAIPAPALAAQPALGDVKPPVTHQPVVATPGSQIIRMATREPGTFEDIVTDACEKIDSFLGMTGGAREKVILGRIELPKDPDRNIDTGNEEARYATLANLLDNAYLPEKWDEALIASGGFCAPAMPDYSIPQISGAQRPVADYLPTVNMNRGSLVVITPPTLAGVVTSTAQTGGSAVGVTTNAADIAATSKPHQVVPCAAQSTITLQAITEILQFGNSMQRAFPELVTTWLANTASAWARRADGELLRVLDGLCTSVSTTAVLGATADFGGYLHQASAQIRNRQRMQAVPQARLRAMVPAWFIDLIGADLMRQHAGDGLDRFLTDREAFVRGLFNAANVNVTFYQDTALATAATNMVFGDQTGGADLENFPPSPGASTRMIWYLFPEGSFARGDGGTLDLGIVRDSTLNNTNDYQFFTESWEALVPHVIEALKITSVLCPSGAGSLDLTGAAYCSAS